MNTDKEYLEKAVINLTVENAKLKLKLVTEQNDRERNWRWYSDEKAKSDELQKQLNRLIDIEVVEQNLETEKTEE